MGLSPSAAPVSQNPVQFPLITVGVAVILPPRSSAKFGVRQYNCHTNDTLLKRLLPRQNAAISRASGVVRRERERLASCGRAPWQRRAPIR
jgi:hypothetical protein